MTILRNSEPVLVMGTFLLVVAGWCFVLPRGVDGEELLDDPKVVQGDPGDGIGYCISSGDPGDGLEVQSNRIRIKQLNELENLTAIVFGDPGDGMDINGLSDIDLGFAGLLNNEGYLLYYMKLRRLLLFY